MQNNIRYLLARRLVRDGQVLRAMPYFPADDTSCVWVDGYTDNPAKDRNNLRKWALAYNEGLIQAREGRTATTRAEGWYKAGLIARAHGLALMGTQNWPDNEVYQSLYDEPGRPTQEKPYATEGEIKRFTAHKVMPALRYHYRYVAVDQMMRAADNLPPRSQAFAAVLCRASTWTTDDKSAIYRRYLRQGAYVPFGTEFGKPQGQCPAPNFTKARYFGPIQAWKSFKRSLHLH